VLGIDVNSFHQRQVDHQAAVAHRLPRDIVPAATDRHFEASIPREIDCVDDICGSETAGDQRGSLVDQTIVNAPRVVVPDLAGQQQRPGEPSGQFADAIPIDA
jgi:hypothetical protein